MKGLKIKATAAPCKYLVDSPQQIKLQSILPFQKMPVLTIVGKASKHNIAILNIYQNAVVCHTKNCMQR